LSRDNRSELRRFSKRIRHPKNQSQRNDSTPE
jgi:hypothetical protein